MNRWLSYDDDPSNPANDEPVLPDPGTDMTQDNDQPVSRQGALRALVDHWRTKVADSGYATATRLCADDLERAMLSGGGDAVRATSKAEVLAAVGGLADAARRVGQAEVVGNSNAAVVASAEVERIAHEIDAMLAAAPVPAVGREAVGEVEACVASGGKQADVAPLYALAIRQLDPRSPAWTRINDAITARWPKGLDRVKKLAWKCLGETK